jgi:hypothetical protein
MRTFGGDYKEKSMNPDTEELRIACAEAVGWSIHQVECMGLDDVAILPPGADLADGWNVFKHAGATLPAYDTDANAALQLVGWLEEREWAVLIERSAGKWGCQIVHHVNQPVDSFATTLPLAICRAFLKAVKSEPATKP